MQAKQPVQSLDNVRLRFGQDGDWMLPISGQNASLAPPVIAVSDLRAAIADAMEVPLSLPSMDQLIVPGDSVVLAVDPSLPAMASVVGTIVRWFCDKGTEPANIKVLLAINDPRMLADVEQGVRDGFAGSPYDGTAVIIESHDPDDPQRNSYVAANDDSDPIYVNRSLVDADVVIPIVCTRHKETFDYLGAYGIFPLFSNRETQGQFYNLTRLDDPVAHQKLKDWADQASWWLGLLAMVQVVPAEGNSVAAVLAGLTVEVEEASQQLFARLWRTDCALSTVVVALLDGSRAQQSWREVARGIRNATRFTSLGGSIVLCTQLNESLGKGLRRLGDAHHSTEEIAKKLAHDSSTDALPAAVMLEATKDYHVYLTSELPRGSIERLGLGVIESESELTHLVSQHTTCTILGSAQHRLWSKPTN